MWVKYLHATRNEGTEPAAYLYSAQRGISRHRSKAGQSRWPTDNSLISLVPSRPSIAFEMFIRQSLCLGVMNLTIQADFGIIYEMNRGFFFVLCFWAAGVVQKGDK